MLNSEGAAAACPSILRGCEWRNFAPLHFGRFWHIPDMAIRFADVWLLVQSRHGRWIGNGRGGWPINISSSSEGTDRTDRPGSKPKDETDGFPNYWNRSLRPRFEVTN